jgi:hypothetical protein
MTAAEVGFGTAAPTGLMARGAVRPLRGWLELLREIESEQPVFALSRDGASEKGCAKEQLGTEKIDPRNFVRGLAGKRTGSKMVWAPARFGGTGPCFAVSETSGMLQMIFRLRNCLAFAVPWPRMFVSDVQNAVPLWHVER